MSGTKAERVSHGLPTLVRWFIDSRQWEAEGLDLPLIDAFSPTEQEAVKRYHFASDRRMSLASQLLKYLFVHHACGVPWDQIVLSRTPKPEGRPYYASKSDTQVEFNVSHQASLTILAGVIAPSQEQLAKQASFQGAVPMPPRIGIDITCVNERRKPITTGTDYSEFISAFTSVFSRQEMGQIQEPFLTLRRARQLGLADAFPRDDEATMINYGLRIFFSYWALKEAYLKMTGEALLAEWLQELEFSNVIPPPVPATSPPQGSTAPGHWGTPYSDIKVSKHGKLIEGVRLQLEAFGADYIIATAGQGCPVGPLYQDSTCSLDGEDIANESAGDRIPISTRLALGQSNPWSPGFEILDPWLPVQQVDIDRDIQSCAKGRCSH
ncbi:4'-phosphopantetheinyl transferase [Penicillium ucsense]|uniref:holo-[acyl-carrier-protein] synthase n=1 Tax=Penicillium ucsense TaxID=2839758 RepID=A0A8J8VWS3_9EURO|nr:4'-phosphopantetheinyl transferase [Penicillium ucsense]KAF7732215.1 4'-phosphopantetheinyl transferase [Penicillium ucsense]